MGEKARHDAHRRRLRELLEQSDLFGPRRPGDRGPVLHAADRDRLAREARIVRKGDREVLWAWGSAGDGVAVVLEGALEIQRTEEGGPTSTLRRLGPGAAVGWSTLGGELHTATLAAAGDTTLAILTDRMLVPLFAARVGFTLRILANFGYLLGKLTDEKLALQSHSVEDRVHAWVLSHLRPGEEMRVRHEDIARFVGATRPRVSQALEKLMGQGVIRLRRGHVRRREAGGSGPPEG